MLAKEWECSFNKDGQASGRTRTSSSKHPVTSSRASSNRIYLRKSECPETDGQRDKQQVALLTCVLTVTKYTRRPSSNSKESFSRRGYFDYFPVLLGDKMAREPRLSALSACGAREEAIKILRPKFTETEWNLYSKLALQPDQLMTSSVGRLFDAVASLLGLADKVSYEGEAALLLEDLGRQFCQREGYALKEAYSIPIQAEDASFVVKSEGLFQQILSDLERGSSAEFIAAKFHFSMVLLLELISNTLKIKKIAFSGGVFQNTLLVDMIEQYFESDYALFFHQQLSPNDENISFGQWAYTALNKLNPNP